MAEDILVSTQVLAKFAVTLLHKMPAARPEDVTAVLDALGPIHVIFPDGDIVRRAVEARAAYGRIWSEDLNPGQEYFGIPVTNPFQ
jgi:predicted nucleic acid-binding protein